MTDKNNQAGVNLTVPEQIWAMKKTNENFVRGEKT
jgi:hypothetical protein